jgi:DedD protein
MAATVVSVVIFLCGVLVGRGVRAERGSTDVATVQTVEPMPQAQEPAPAPPEADPTKASPPPPVDDLNLTYHEQLEKPNAPPEDLKPADPGQKPPRAEPRVARATPPPAPPPAPKEPVRAAPPPAPASDVASSGASGDGFAVQIAALNVRSEADAIARRLSSKGYTAYVVAPPSGTPTVFRVRVGKFPTRREAESIAAKLQREEQYKPWITR